MTSVDPGMVRRGDGVTIIGEGLGDSSELVDVHLGDTLTNLPTNSDDVTVMVSVHVCVCNVPVHSYVHVLMPSSLLGTVHECITAIMSTVYCT